MLSFDLSNLDWWIVILAIASVCVVRAALVVFETVAENKRVRSYISILKDLDGINKTDVETSEYNEFRKHVFSSLPKKKVKEKKITPLMICMAVWMALTIGGYFLGFAAIDLLLLFVLLFVGGLIGNMSYEIGFVKGELSEKHKKLDEALNKKE